MTGLIGNANSKTSGLILRLGHRETEEVKPKPFGLFQLPAKTPHHGLIHEGFGWPVKIHAESKRLNPTLG